MTGDLYPEAVLAEARARTGLADFGSDHFRDDLELWISDLARPQLSDEGRASLRRMAVRNLSLRLRLTRTFQDHPEIADVPIPPILLVSGFPRSGTTLLHSLLDLHPMVRTLRKWELLAPLPAPEAETWDRDPRIERVQASIDELRGSQLEHMHWVNAKDPEECPHGYYDCSGLLGRGAGGAAPSWWRNLSRRDERPTFEEQRRLMQLLLWHHRVPDGCVLVLKSPTIAGRLTAFADAFPEARFLLCHRDPFRCVTSTTVLADVVARPFYADGVTLDDALPGGAETVLDHLCTFARGMLTLRDQCPDLVGSVGYQQLMDDSVASSAAALKELALECPGDWEERVTGFLSWQRAGGRAAPPAAYTVALTRAMIDEREEMATYAQDFEVPVERVRVAAPSK